MMTSAEARANADAAPHLFPLGEKDGFLGTRALGRRVRDEVEEILAQGHSLILDWQGVDGISQSFADELVGKLAVEMGAEEFKRRVRFAHLSPAVGSILRYTVASRLTPSKLRH